MGVNSYCSGGSRKTNKNPYEGNILEEINWNELCIPWDNLNDINLYPNFSDHLISLDDIKEVKGGFCCPETDPLTLTRKKARSKGLNRKSSKIVKFAPFKTWEKQVNGSMFEKRRCTHCEAEETPQWRMGPMGPKTLCNACGVRFKSGRLLPEYRPKASPTFDSNKHSNYHRKIVERKSE